MKTVGHKIGNLLRFGAVAVALLLGQQAFAVGTDAGTSISNSASVVYDVNGATQTAVASTVATFTVDRIVSFTLVQQGAADTITSPGAFNAATAFELTNTGNSPLDFSLSAINLAAGIVVNSTADDADMDATFEFAVANGDGAGGTPIPGTDLTFVDGLAEDATVVIWVLADAPLTLINGQIANIELTATAADPGAGVNPAPDSSLGVDLTASVADGDQAIDVVFNDAGRDGFEAARDGYAIVSASLTITKTAVIIDDPVNAVAPFFAIPGATIEYTINIANTGTVDATDIVISDTLDANLIFQVGAYSDAGTPVDVSIGGTTFCIADAADADGDGCALDGAVLTIGGADWTVTSPAAPINVAAGTNIDISFQVVINAT